MRTPGATPSATPGRYLAPGEAPRPPAAERARRLGLFALAVIGGLLGLGVFWLHLTSDPLIDVRAYYDAAARLNAGQPLYPAVADPDLADFYRYPPLLAIVLRPLALLPFHVAAVAWGAAMLAAFVLTIRRLGGGRRVWFAVGLLGIPIGWALAIGQAHPLVVLLVAVGQPWAIALATNLKLFPALIAVWWIGRRDWGALAAYVAWMVLLGLGQWLIAPEASVAFLGTLTLDQVGEVRNVSPFEIAPELWAVLLVIGGTAALVLAPTRWGWPAAVALATLAPPRLLIYMLSGLLAALREPDPPVGDDGAGGGPGGRPGVPDAAEAYVASAR